MKDERPKNDSNDNRKEWETPTLIKEDMDITKGGGQVSPTRENPFYHT